MTKVRLMSEGDRQMLNAIHLTTGIPIETLMHEAIGGYLRDKYIKHVATSNGKR